MGEGWREGEGAGEVRAAVFRRVREAMVGVSGRINSDVVTGAVELRVDRRDMEGKREREERTTQEWGGGAVHWSVGSMAHSQQLTGKSDDGMCHDVGSPLRRL